MLCFPNAKINLGLQVIRRRPDGYHDIESLLVPIGWCDVLEAVPSAEGPTSANPRDLPEIEFSSSGIPLHIGDVDNLCVRAARNLMKIRSLPALAVHLHKAVPPGAGLGGGSSDATAMLVLLDRLLQLGLAPDELHRLALSLGSDCPFFVENSPCLATGRGEILEPFDLDPGLGDVRIAVVKPACSVATAEAYGWVTPTSGRPPLKEVLSGPPDAWKDGLVNDFERPVIDRYPEIGAVRDKLYDLGAFYASLSGSGSSVFGLFRTKVRLKQSFPGLPVWSGPWVSAPPAG